MDLREIIKWFIPCFHILLKTDARMLFIWLLVFCNLCPGLANSVSELDESSHLNSTKNIISFDSNTVLNQSEIYKENEAVPKEFSSRDASVGRTFGRPMKKMIQALVPLAMAIGSAGTWAVVAALIGAKTLVVTLFILKLLLMAGAAKAMELIETGLRNKQAFYNSYDSGYQNPAGYQNQVYPNYMKQLPVQPKPLFGGLIASKTHHQPQHYAPPPSKEIHLHIHNNPHGHHHEEEVIPNFSSWSRDSPPSQIAPKTEAEAYNPYLYLAGPQTIRTPYGNYIKVDKK